MLQRRKRVWNVALQKQKTDIKDSLKKETKVESMSWRKKNKCEMMKG
jgi:hypothetical protein